MMLLEQIRVFDAEIKAKKKVATTLGTKSSFFKEPDPISTNRENLAESSDGKDQRQQEQVTLWSIHPLNDW